MKLYIKDIFNFYFLFLLLMFITLFIYTICLFFRLYKAFLANKIIIRIVFFILVFLWIYYETVNLKQELLYIDFVCDFLLELSAYIMVIDIAVWIIVKFLEQWSFMSLKRELDPNNPKRLKLEIENLICEHNFKDNPDMIKLYEILQISVLSIEKQKEIIRNSFWKNMLISIFFFILGLIIPKIIIFII